MCPQPPEYEARSAPKPGAAPHGPPAAAFPPVQPPYPSPQPQVVYQPGPFQPTGPTPMVSHQAMPPPLVQQVTVIAPPPLLKQDPRWTAGLFGCFEDLSNCVITLVCPCVTFGQIAEIASEEHTGCCCAATVCTCLFCLFGFFCCYTCTFRAKLRTRLSIPGDQLNDFCVHFFFTYCALCQEYRELKNRGIEPSAGWSGNKEKMQQAMVPPGVPVGMMH